MVAKVTEQSNIGEKILPNLVSKDSQSTIGAKAQPKPDYKRGLIYLTKLIIMPGHAFCS